MKRQFVAPQDRPLGYARGRPGRPHRVSLGAVTLLAISLAAPFAYCQKAAADAGPYIQNSPHKAQWKPYSPHKAQWKPFSPHKAQWKPFSPGVAVAASYQEAAQVQREVQAELAKAQAEIARAMEEIKNQTGAKVKKEIAAKLAAPRKTDPSATLGAGRDAHTAHRGTMLADFTAKGAVETLVQARQAELAALAQEKEKAHRVVEPLLAFEDSENGWLGVQIADVDSEKVKELKLPAERGARITEVEKDSPAAKAGLKVNDVVTEFNGQRIESATQFRRMVRESLAGRAAQLTIWRDARSQSLSVTLGSSRDRVERSFRIFRDRDFHFNFSLPEIDILIGSRAPLLGISADDISGQLGAYFGAPGGEGILVREVHSGSPAEKAGMKAGDVITKMDGERVRSLSELREKLRAKREQKRGDTAPSAVKSVSAGVIRKGAEVSLTVEIEQPRAPERRRPAARDRSAL